VATPHSLVAMISPYTNFLNYNCMLTSLVLEVTCVGKAGFKGSIPLQALMVLVLLQTYVLLQTSYVVCLLLKEFALCNNMSFGVINSLGHFCPCTFFF